jgi:hypothetical protein
VQAACSIFKEIDSEKNGDADDKHAEHKKEHLLLAHRAVGLSVRRQATPKAVRFFLTYQWVASTQEYRRKKGVTVLCGLGATRFRMTASA